MSHDAVGQATTTTCVPSVSVIVIPEVKCAETNDNDAMKKLSMH